VMTEIPEGLIANWKLPRQPTVISAQRASENCHQVSIKNKVPESAEKLDEERVLGR